MNENGRIGCLLKKLEGKKVLEAFLETQKGTFKVETTSDMEKFHVIDTEKYNEDMDAAVDNNTRTFDRGDTALIGAFIVALEPGTDIGVKVTDEKITMLDESKAAAAMTQASKDNTSLWAVINGVCINTDWIQTDDLQYVRQVEEYVYELAEARYIGPADKDSYLIVSGRIDVRDWLDNDNGNYTEDCVEIIKTFYSSVEDYEQAAENAGEGYQYLAEMIFEETAYEELDYRIIEGDEDAAYHELKHRLYILEPLSMKGETDE